MPAMKKKFKSVTEMVREMSEDKSLAADFERRIAAGKTVEITVVEKEPTTGLAPGHGNWDAVAQAARELVANGTYDFDAVRHQDEIDLHHAEDHIK
jgi:hypothetical protein